MSWEKKQEQRKTLRADAAAVVKLYDDYHYHYLPVCCAYVSIRKVFYKIVE